MNTYQSIKRHFKLNWKQYLEAISDVADIVVLLGAKPTKLGLLSVGLRLTNSYVSKVLIEDTSNPFSSEDWDYIPMSIFRKYIVEYIMSNYKCKAMTENREYDASYYYGEVEGFDVGFYVNKNNDDFLAIYVKKGKVEEFFELLRNKIWLEYKSNNISIKCMSSDMHHYIPVENKDDKKCIASKTAKEIYERIEKFNKHGYNRSIMLVGESGTGKSTAIKYISKEMNKRTLKINASDEMWDDYASESIVEIVSLLKPNVLIIDDFDRIEDKIKLLNSLEQINDNIELFIVSVNSKRFDSALIRPGRFDELINFNKLDDEIINSMTEGIPEGIQNRLKKMPISYISEFKKRREVLGDEIAINEIESLEKRLKENILNNENDDD